MGKLLGVGLAAMLAAALLAAGGGETKTDLPPELDLVPRDAAGFVSVRVGEVLRQEGVDAVRKHLTKELPEAMAEVEKLAGVDPANVERATLVLARLPNRGEQGVIFLLVITTAKPYDPAKVRAALLPDGTEEKHKGKPYYVSGEAAWVRVNDRTYAMGLTSVVQGAMDQIGAKKLPGPLDDALALAAGKHHLAAGMNVEAFRKAITQEPDQGQLEPFRPLLEGKSAAVTVDLGDKVTVDVRLKTGSEGDAREAVKAGKTLVAMLQEQLPMLGKELEKDGPKAKTLIKLFTAFSEGLKAMPVEARGDSLRATLTVKADVPTLSTGVMEGIAKARGAATVMTSANNLKQIGLAFHNYHDTYSACPAAAICDKDGKPLLSWRVAILPFIEEDQLYKEFKLDEAWDSPHNKKLIGKMPKIYALPGPDGPTSMTTTHYRVFTGKDTPFDGAKGPVLTGITDGTSNTILAVEARDAVTWTKPDDLPYAAGKPVPKIGTAKAERVNILFFDGSVRPIKASIDEDTLRAIITPAGGEVVKIPE